jgi:hypothetical protein
LALIANGLTVAEIVTLRNLAHDLDMKVAVLEAQREAGQEALKIAFSSLDAYKAANNEWRATLGDLINRFQSKTEIGAMFERRDVQTGALADRLFMLEKSKSMDTGKSEAGDKIWARAITIISIALIALGLILHYVH